MVKSVQTLEPARLDRSRESEMEDARDRADLTHGLQSPDMMPPDPRPLGSATRPSPLPIPQIAGSSRSATAPNPIHALIAREEMKHMNGAHLARRLPRPHPDIQVQLMRRPGNRPELEVAERAPAVEKPDSALIEDPFTPATLCKRVSERLASSQETHVGM
jgi:hypothetical protein